MGDDTPSKKYIAIINLANGEVRYVKDAEARTLISGLTERMVTAESDITTLKAAVTDGAHFLGKAWATQAEGVTIEDGSDDQTIDVVGVRPKDGGEEGETEEYAKSVTASAGDFVIVSATGTTLEFIWDGAAWRELGSTGTLKALAFKDSASASYTPAGDVTVGSQTAGGTVSQPTFTGNEAAITGSFSGTQGTATGTFTPAGTVSTPTITVTPTTASFDNVAITVDDANESMTITTTSKTFMTEASASSSQPSFTGTEGNVSATITPAGSISINSITPTGTVSQPTFEGTAHTHSATFAGTAATITVS